MSRTSSGRRSCCAIPPAMTCTFSMGTDSLALSYKVYDHMKEEAARHAQDGAEKEAQA